jgi:hypothetical protein
MRTIEKFESPPPRSEEKKAKPWLALRNSCNLVIHSIFTPGTGIRVRNL